MSLGIDFQKIKPLLPYYKPSKYHYKPLITRCDRCNTFSQVTEYDYVETTIYKCYSCCSYKNIKLICRVFEKNKIKFWEVNKYLSKLKYKYKSSEIVVYDLGEILWRQN